MIDTRTIVPGLAIPAFSREGTLQHWNRYAGVNYEFADHHMDDEIGRYEGFDAAIGMGPLIHAYMHTMLRQWVGEDDGRVVSVSMQLRQPFLRGRTLTAQGEVKEVRTEGGEVIVGLEIWADDDKGARLVNGTARVALPA